MAATKGKAKEPRTPLLTPAQRRDLARTAPAWRVAGKRLVREWEAADFDAAMALVDAVAARAKAADHHPDIHLTKYRNVRIETTSHDAGGLTERDFSLAAEIDRFPEAAVPTAAGRRPGRGKG
jgi:4a-hydroxytetrahydrobiopterin dehydratase